MDVEVVQTSVCLTCPISHCRIETAVIGARCSHLQCFDASSLRAMSERMLPQTNARVTQRLRCPLCAHNVDVDTIVPCPRFQGILDAAPADATHALIASDGSVTYRNALLVSRRIPFTTRARLLSSHLTCCLLTKTAGATRTRGRRPGLLAVAVAVAECARGANPA